MLSYVRPSTDEELNGYCSSLLLASFIRYRRQLLEMSVSYAAELAGIDFYEWATLEAGRVPERGSAQFYSIAGVLKVDTDSLLQLANISRTAAA